MSEKMIGSIRLLLAETATAEHYQNELALRSCNNVELLQSVEDGNEILCMIQNQQIDLLIMDLWLSGMDGIAVLRELSAMDNIQKPVIIVATPIKSNLIISEAMNLGATYAIKKPMDAKLIAQRALDIYHLVQNENQTLVQQTFLSSELHTEVGALIRELNVPPHLLGYKYLISSVKHCVQGGGFNQNITTVLYPKIAIEYNSTSPKVERSIRHAIELTWKRNDPKRLCKILNLSEKGLERPSNSEFVARCTEVVLLRLREQGYYASFS